MFATLDLKARSAGQAHPSFSLAPDLAGERPKKRAQVRRACDRCRLMRIKCDNDRPCYQCREARRECANSSRKGQFRSLASAVQEVEALRAQLRESEMEKHQKGVSGDDASRPPSPETEANASPAISVPSQHPPTALHLSPAFFLPRMRWHLQKIRPQAVAELLAGSGDDIHGLAPSPPPPSDARAYLSPDQEAHALTLFWKSHFFSFPLLNESHFWRQYRALVTESEAVPKRKPSPLVDIVLALCLQFASYVHSSADGQETFEAHRPSLAGFQYFRRCQDVLDQNLDDPTLAAVQCYVFSVMYLFEAGCLKRAQITLGKAIATATMLRLQHEPQSGGSDHEMEVSRRTWWALYVLDARLSVETGWSPMIPPGTSTRNPPSDSMDFAQWLAPLYHHNPACPLWLGFQTQTVGMLRAIGAARVSLDATYANAVGDAGQDLFIRDGAAREECARCLALSMERVYAWAKRVPKGYYVPRKEGAPFCTDRSVLDLSVNPNILVHCQFQRLLIELHYHYQCMSLYQAFICFPSPAGTSTPVADGIATAAAHHAIALTSMVHQALTTSEALSGVYHIFRYQKAALLIMLGYVYCFPLSPVWTSIRDSIDMAISVIKMYRRVISEAAFFAKTAQALADDVGGLVKNFLGAGGAGGSSRTLPLSATQTPPSLATAGTSAFSSEPSPPAAHEGFLTTTIAGEPTSALGWPSGLTPLQIREGESNETSLLDAQWFSLPDDAISSFWDDMIAQNPTQW